MKVIDVLKSIFSVTLLSLIVSCSQYEIALPDQNSEPEMKPLRSMDDLKSYAVSAYSKLCGTKGRSSAVVKNIVPVGKKSRSDVLNEIYAVNFENDGGYVLTTTNPSIEPILAVVEEGSFEEDKLPDGVKSFIRAAQSHKPEAIGPVTPEIPIDTNLVNFQYWELRTDTLIGKKIEPQLKVWWGQDYLYSYFTPTYLNPEFNQIEHVPIGCVPTAISMALTFSKHISILPITFDGRQEILSLNWNEILKHKKYDMCCDIEPTWLSGDCEASPNTHLAIATLLRQIGELCNVDYDNLNSGASFNYAYNCIQQLDFNFESKSPNEGFQYDRVCKHLNNDEILLMFGFDLRNQYNEVHNNHCFIIDGCDCLAYQVTFTVYEEIPTAVGIIRKPLYSYVEEEYASHLAHVVWGFDEQGVGYFSDNILRTISPIELDDGAVNLGKDYYYTYNQFMKILKPKAIVPEFPILLND